MPHYTPLHYAPLYYAPLCLCISHEQSECRAEGTDTLLYCRYISVYISKAYHSLNPAVLGTLRQLSYEMHKATNSKSPSWHRGECYKSMDLILYLSCVLLLVGHMTDNFYFSHDSVDMGHDLLWLVVFSLATQEYLFHRKSYWLPLLYMTRYYYSWVLMTCSSYYMVTHTRIAM